MQPLTCRMTRNHCLITGACVVSLALGYLVGGVRASSADSGKTAGQPGLGDRPASTSSRDRKGRENAADELLSNILKGRSTQDLTDGELVKIVLQLSKPDPTQDAVSRARQAYQLQLLLKKLSTTRLEQAAAAVAGDPDSKRNGSIGTILAALTSKDPQRALTWAKTQTNAPNLLASVIGIMAKNDPTRAAELYRNGLLDGTFSQHDGFQASYGIATTMARLGSKPLLDYVDSLPQQQQSNTLSNSYREIPENERAGMLDEIYQRSKDGRLQDWSFKSIFANSVMGDKARAEAWLDKIEPGKERATLELSAASYLSRGGDADAAREWMSRAISQSPGKEKELLSEAIDQMGYSSPRDLVTFVSLLPDSVEIRADDLKNQANNIAYRGFNGLAALAGAIRDPDEQTKFLTTTLDQYTASAQQGSHGNKLNATDFEVITRQLQNLNLTGENATKVQQALDTARNAKVKAR